MIHHDPADRLITACFTGHRDIPPAGRASLKNRVYTALLHAYEAGYRVFLCGGARGFDLLAASEVIRLRGLYPDVRLVMVIPCATQPDRWPPEEQAQYRSILDRADAKEVLSDVYFTGCMQKRNREMVDASSLCLCYMTRFQGGTWSTVRYALHCSVNLLNLAIPGEENARMREPSWSSIFISRSVSENAGIVRLYPIRRQRYRRKPIPKRCSVKRTGGSANLRSR